MYHHQNGLKVGKTTKATVVAVLAIWEKARIYAHCTACGFMCLQDPKVVWQLQSAEEEQT